MKKLTELVKISMDTIKGKYAYFIDWELINRYNSKVANNIIIHPEFFQRVEAAELRREIYKDFGLSISTYAKIKVEEGRGFSIPF